MPLTSIHDAVFGFLAAAVPGGATWLATRSTFTSRVMKMVEDRCQELEREVAECRERDRVTGARIYFLEGSIRMALPELARLDAKNLVLKQVVGALKALPEPAGDLTALIDELHLKTPGTSYDGKRWSDGPEEGQ